MVFKKSVKRRRSFKRRRSVKRRQISAYKAPMPNKYPCKLRYCSYFNIDPGAAGIAGVNVIAANGMFDPEISGVGHQPRGFDQLMTMYDHYTVIGSKITVSYSHLFGNNYDAYRIGINVKDSPVTAIDPNDYLEGRNLVSSTMPPVTGGDGACTRTLSMKFSTKKFLGVSHPLASENVRGNATANPGEMGYFHIWAAPLSSVDGPAITCAIRIEYLCVLTEPKQPTQS